MTEFLKSELTDFAQIEIEKSLAFTELFALLNLFAAEERPFLRMRLPESPFAMRIVALEIVPNLEKVLRNYLFH